MPILQLNNRTEVQSKLQLLVKVHRWSLNLQNNLMRLEIGRSFEQTDIHEVSIERLKTLMAPEEIQAYLQHFEDALVNGHAGPVVLPFITRDGSRSLVESACCPYVHGNDRFLLGVFKRLPEANKPTRNARILAEFLESFIENSPSGIVVTDSSGHIVSVNKEFLRFVGKMQKSDVIRHSVLDTVYALNSGLGAVVRNALSTDKSTRGRYEMTHPNGMRQTLYWRAFPLSGTERIAPPKVFAFDLNESGPRAA